MFFIIIIIIIIIIKADKSADKFFVSESKQDISHRLYRWHAILEWIFKIASTWPHHQTKVLTK